MTAAPVTVSITRHIDPGHTAEMTAWVEAGASLAKGFDGFLGVGWVRPHESSDEWHMLYRFASREALAVWESSAQRAWWLAAALGRIGESRVERRTGIEGWFDKPGSIETIETAPSAGRPPPVWKQGDRDLAGVLPAQPPHDLVDRPLPARRTPRAQGARLDRGDDADHDLPGAAPDDPGARLVAAPMTAVTDGR